MAIAVSILLECTCSIKAGGADSVTSPTWGSAVIFTADKVTCRRTVDEADHSGGQDAEEFPRFVKGRNEVTVECKFSNPDLIDLLQDNDVAQLTIANSRTGMGMDPLACLITGYEPEYAGPSTLRFTLKSRGQQITFS